MIPSTFTLSQNPHIQWWSQQMQTQQYQQNQSNLESQNLYQINPSLYPQSVQVSPFQQSKSRDGGYRNIPMRDLSSISDQSPQKIPLENLNNGDQNQNHPFKGPKIHLFKKGNSRRIKTSSATRNFQPVYSIENNKINMNFNSINNAGGAANTAQNVNESAMYYQNNQSIIYENNKSKQDQENQYQSLSQVKNNQVQSQNIKKLSPVNSIFQNIGGTIDVYANDELNNMKISKDIQKVQLNKQLQMRPNTTNLDQLISENSPKRQQQFLGKQNALDPSSGVQNLSKMELQEEINGFKHSFYNDKNSQPQKNKSPNNIDSYRQTKEKIVPNTDGIKHIFVLNMDNRNNNNKTSNQQSTQDSKAMTPCFIQTPNMTDKWGNFKSNQKPKNEQVVIQAIAQVKQQNKQLFVKDKQIKGLPVNKKPLTSHQSKNQSIHAINNNNNNSKNEYESNLVQGNSNNNNSNNNYYEDNIQITQSDISLSAINTSNSRNLSNHNKPPTSNSYKRPLSRNHPILNIKSQNIQKTPEKTTSIIKPSQHEQNRKVNFSSFKASEQQMQQTSGLIREYNQEEEIDT